MEAPRLLTGCFSGWGPGIRTPTYGSRDRCPTIRRVPSVAGEILPYGGVFRQTAFCLGAQANPANSFQPWQLEVATALVKLACADWIPAAAQYGAISTSAGMPSSAFNLRIIRKVKGRFRLSTSDTRARVPMYGSRSLRVRPRLSM